MKKKRMVYLYLPVPRQEEQLQPFRGKQQTTQADYNGWLCNTPSENPLAAFLTDIVHLKKLHFLLIKASLNAGFVSFWRHCHISSKFTCNPKQASSEDITLLVGPE